MRSDEPVSAVASIDQRVGRRLRRLRIERGLSLQCMATVVGVSYQQIQKYEAGRNRIAASTLFSVANHFRIPIAWFFRDDGPH